MTPLIGAMPEIPKHPTPWESDGTMIYDANGGLVFYTGTDVDGGDASDLTAQMVDLVNAHYAPLVHLSPEDEASDDEEPREVTDGDGDVWHWVAPNAYVLAPNKEVASERDSSNRYPRISLSYIRENYC